MRTAACPVDGWLACQRAVAPATRARGASGAQCRPIGDPAFRGTTAVVDRWATYVETAAEGSFEAEPGLLGQSLRAARVDVAAVGPGAAIALSGEDGLVDGQYFARPGDPTELSENAGRGPRLERSWS